ncbi:MAG: hypothetical protein HYT87_20230 [Nitrospirae bacterium]|nr:hypothetical protein [Nitrospirota bacterium]
MNTTEMARRHLEEWWAPRIKPWAAETGRNLFAEVLRTIRSVRFCGYGHGGWIYSSVAFEVATLLTVEVEQAFSYIDRAAKPAHTPCVPKKKQLRRLAETLSKDNLVKPSLDYPPCECCLERIEKRFCKKWQGLDHLWWTRLREILPEYPIDERFEKRGFRYELDEVTQSAMQWVVETYLEELAKAGADGREELPPPSFVRGLAASVFAGRPSKKERAAAH